MQHIVDSFFEYLHNEKRTSPHTIVAYTGDLNQFFAFLGESNQETLKLIKPKTVRNWIVVLHNEGMSSRTIHRKVSTLRAFFKHLQQMEILDTNPAMVVNLPKIPKRLPQFVHNREMELLLDHVEFEPNYEGVRNKLIIELFYGTGMRLSELVFLRRTDIREEEGLVKVMGKRQKERLIPLTRESLILIKEYIQIKNATFGVGISPWFFLTIKGEQIYHKLVYRIVHSSLSKVTTMKQKSPHILRHSFATVLLNGGADINAIKELLGHSNLNATQIYAHNTFEKINAIYKQAHPRA